MSPTDPGRSSTTKAWRGMGRAAGGALVFSLPMLMTMEMWALGFTMDRTRMVVMILVTIPLLMGLSRHIGFERTHGWRDDLLDSLVACGIAIVVSLVVLLAFGTIGPGMAAGEIIGKVAIQMVPGAIGALLARAQFRASRDEEDGAEREESYGGELFLMAVGSLFLGFNVAPTEETVLISFQMTPWHAFALVLLSLALMHGFVFALGFAGGSELSPQTPWWSAFLRFTLPGYVIAAAISLFVLWLFGRTDGVDLGHVVMATVVLAFPSSIGAAAARLVL